MKKYKDMTDTEKEEFDKEIEEDYEEFSKIFMPYHTIISITVLIILGLFIFFK